MFIPNKLTANFKNIKSVKNEKLKFLDSFFILKSRITKRNKTDTAPA